MMTTTDRMRLDVSAGHGEYWVENVPGLTITTLWDPSRHEEEVDEMGEDELVEVYERTFDKYPPVEDLSWNHIVRWSGPRRAVVDGLVQLLNLLRGVGIDVRVPSGDDDVFDYWPSGARYALAIANHLGNGWERTVPVILRQVTATLGDLQDEIEERIGIGKISGPPT